MFYESNDHRPKRNPLIVFAGVQFWPPYLHALRTRRVGAIMSRFPEVQTHWLGLRAVLDLWPQHRYLDSGAFLLLRQARTPTLAEVQRHFGWLLPVPRKVHRLLGL